MQLHLFIPNLTTAIHFFWIQISTASKPTDYNLFSTLLLALSLKHLNTIISLLISNLSTGSKSHKTHTIQNSLSHTSHCNSNVQPSSILELLKIQPTHSTRSSAVVTLQRPPNPSRLKITDRSFYHQAPLSGIHCPNIRVLFLQHHLLKPTTLSSHCLPLNSTNNWKPIFPFNPILPRLSTLRTDTLELDSDWFTRHSHSISFFIHQHIIHRVAFFYTWCSQCTGKSWQKSISVSFMVHFKSSSFSHIINLTSFHHMFC